MYAQHSLAFVSQSKESSVLHASKDKETETTPLNKTNANAQQIDKSMVTQTSTPANQYPDDLKNVLQKGTRLDGPSVRILRWRNKESPDDATTANSPVIGKANTLPGVTPPASSGDSSDDSQISERPLAQNLVENRQLRQQFVLQLQWLRDKQEEEERAGDFTRAKEYSRLVQRITLVLEKLKQQVPGVMFPVTLLIPRAMNF